MTRFKTNNTNNILYSQYFVRNIFCFNLWFDADYEIISADIFFASPFTNLYTTYCIIKHMCLKKKNQLYTVYNYFYQFIQDGSSSSHPLKLKFINFSWFISITISKITPFWTITFPLSIRIQLNISIKNF